MKDNQQVVSVFYEGQDDLADILAVSICSVCYNTEKFVNFYILDCGICAFNKKLLESLKSKFNNFSLEFIPVDLTQFHHLTPWCKKFWDCYARLIIPELKPDVKKAVYLDTDILALDDIGKPWNEPLNGYAFAAAADIGYGDFFFNNCVGNLNVSPRHIYANAGVLLLDCEKWRKDNICQKLLQLADQYKQHIHIICEDILSIYFSENQYRLLPARYNLTDRDNLIQKTVAPAIDDNYLQEEWKHIILQHLSPGKAWKKAYSSETCRELKHFDSFWFFAEMTPFYAGLQKKFEYYNSLEATDRELSKRENQERKDIIRILGVPVITLYKLGNKKRYKLFNLLTIMTVKGK